MEAARLQVDFKEDYIENIVGSAINHLVLVSNTAYRRQGDTTKLYVAVNKINQLLDGRESDEHFAVLRSARAASLGVLGIWEHNFKRLNQAIKEHEFVLDKYSRDSNSLLWAQTQNSLGVIRAYLGTMQKNSDLLIEAVKAHREALDIYKQYIEKQDDLSEWYRMEWAGTQNNLGLALTQLGHMTRNTDFIEEGIEAITTSLEVGSKDEMSFAWPASQHNLCGMLSILGELGGSTDLYRSSITTCNIAHNIRTFERAPIGWAQTQYQLGSALFGMGMLRGDPDLVNKAVQEYAKALEVYTIDKYPDDWAGTHYAMGNAYFLLATMEDDKLALLNSAADEFREALKVRSQDKLSIGLVNTQRGLAAALLKIGISSKSTVHIKEAIDVFELGLKGLNCELYVKKCAEMNKNLDMARTVLGELQ